jgi:hypothetical protein
MVALHEQVPGTKNEMTRRVLRIGKSNLAMLVAAGLLAASTQAQQPLPTQPPMDPATHAAHAGSGTHPAPADATKGEPAVTQQQSESKGDPALAQQISELRQKVAQLEAALARNAPKSSTDAAPAAGPMSGTAAPAAPMAGMSGTAPAATAPAGGTGGMAAPAGGEPNMMGMMGQMMGMMGQMMSMSGAMPGGASTAGAMPAGAPTDRGGMGMQSKVGGMGSGAATAAGAPASGMSGSGSMGMGKMEMAGKMGMGPMGSGAAGAMPQSVLPGFPGASHLYHIGATGFFLDHPQHIALTTEQQAALSRAMEQALLAKSTADRAIQQAEQELWTLTAADQPDAVKIEAKIGEIGKLTGEERLAFIRAVGNASTLLTDEQRRILTGFAPPAPAAAMPASGMDGDM